MPAQPRVLAAADADAADAGAPLEALSLDRRLSLDATLSQGLYSPRCAPSLPPAAAAAANAAAAAAVAPPEHVTPRARAAAAGAAAAARRVSRVAAPPLRLPPPPPKESDAAWFERALELG